MLAKPLNPAAELRDLPRVVVRQALLAVQASDLANFAQCGLQIRRRHKDADPAVLPSLIGNSRLRVLNRSVVSHGEVLYRFASRGEIHDLERNGRAMLLDAL